MNLTEISIRRPLTVLMVFLGVILFGFISVTNLPVNLFPDVTFPMMFIMTSYPGAGPAEIETQITDPLEQSLGTVNNLDEITSTTSENLSLIFMQFDWGADIDAASNDVRDVLGYMTPYLPEDADYPLIFKFDISQQPVVMYTVGGDINPLELDKIAEDVADKLQRVGGVAASYAMSEAMKEVQIVLDPLTVENDRRKFRIWKCLAIQVGFTHIVELKILIWHNQSPIIIYELRFMIIAVAPA